MTLDCERTVGGAAGSLSAAAAFRRAVHTDSGSHTKELLSWAAFQSEYGTEGLAAGGGASRAELEKRPAG